MGWGRVWCALGMAAAAVAQTPPTGQPSTPPPTPLRPGLYLVNVVHGWDEYIGPYSNPSIDPEGRLLYADDGRGHLVRWRLDSLETAPEVFANPPAKEPGYRFAVAAPKGGLVAAFQAFPVEQPGSNRARVAVSFLTRDGKRIAGGLPLFITSTRYNGAAAVAWRPDGQQAAFCLATGNSLPGAYVFRPSNRQWVRVRDLSPVEGAPDWPLAWQEGGRSLSELLGGKLVLRGGGDYAEYRALPTTARYHTWIDMDSLLLADPKAGLSVIDVEGKTKSTIAGWPGPVAGVGNASLPVVHAHGLAWIRAVAPGPQAGTLRYAVHYARHGEREGADVFTFTAHTAYALGNAGPVWHPDKAVVFVSVPRLAQ
jgi:hypothetical protein